MIRLHRGAAVRMFVLATAALANLFCATASTPPPSDSVATAEEKRPETAASDAPWHQVAESELEIMAERSLPDFRNQSVAIYGDVAIWNGNTQLYLSRAEIRQILAAFDEADFQSLPEVTGPGKLLRRRAAIEAGSFRKESAQTAESAENPALKQLVDSILATVEPLVPEHGLRIGSLSEGLGKIAGGEIAPETLTVNFHVRPATDDGREPFVLSIAGGRAELRLLRGEEIARPVTIRVAEDEMREFARRLAEFDPEPLPGNLFDEDYTELRIEVLGHEKKVMARPFANFPRSRHGELQVRFDHLAVWLEQVRERWFRPEGGAGAD